MSEQLELEPLEKAIASFHIVLGAYETSSQLDDVMSGFVRDAAIQRFEYCYDLSTKFIKRHLSLVAADPEEVRSMSFQEVIREAYTIGVLKNSWDMWKDYRNNRNITSHAYDETKAIQVAEALLPFYRELEFLLERLQRIHEA